ncbi:MAG: class I SAM-dependent methyltransferase [Acidobacteriota bacterium]|nr:class I SAM-dependent methyltransferase [Acidobacteriota bacterium]
MNTPSKAAHDDWDRHWRNYAEAAENNPAQRYRRELIFDLLRRSGCPGGARILDIGSGQGDLALALGEAFAQAEIAGVELSAAGVAEAAAKIPSARFLQRDLLDPEADPGALSSWAQFAVCAEVLEHLDDPALFLKHAARYLAPGCTLVVTVPGGPQSEFDRHIGHRQHFTPGMLRTLLEASGFAVQMATTAGFPFFNLYRMAVILRGKRLITDVRSGSTGASSGLARIVMSAFRPLFALNFVGSTLGWQTIATAQWPGDKKL